MAFGVWMTASTVQKNLVVVEIKRKFKQESEWEFQEQTLI